MIKKHQYGERFMLMWYACDCGHRERIWNSRNGVTPFCLACPSCGGMSLRHTDWNLDAPAPDHVLHHEQRYFVNGTPEEAAAIMERRIASVKDPEYMISDEEAAELIESARRGDGEFRPGWPSMRRKTPVSGPVSNFQDRVGLWMAACFGPEISADKIERNHRFLEEALELVQACGCTADEAHQLVDYVYGRPQGDVNQETGGVMVTLAALCLANGIDMDAAGETELARVWQKIETIRAKQAAKPKHSPLPGTGDHDGR